MIGKRGQNLSKKCKDLFLADKPGWTDFGTALESERSRWNALVYWENGSVSADRYFYRTELLEYNCI